MNRSTILILVLSSWVLAACGGSSFSTEDPHDHEGDEHAEEHDEHDHEHGHGHEEEMYTQLQDWLERRDEFDDMPMPEPPDGMTVSVGMPVSASWSGDIVGTINPSYPDYTHPQIELVLDDHADMHGNVYVDTPDDEHMLVHHLDAENVTSSSFASPPDDENRMTGTFYGNDHGTVVGTVNTAVVIGTYQAEKTESTH